MVLFFYKREKMNKEIEAINKFKENPTIAKYLISWVILLTIGYLIYSWVTFQEPSITNIYCDTSDTILSYKELKDKDIKINSFIGCEMIDTPIVIQKATEYKEGILKVRISKDYDVWVLKEDVIGYDNMERVNYTALKDDACNSLI